MRTTWIIARRELTDISRDGRCRVSAANIFALLLVSLAAGWLPQRAVSAIHRDAEHAVREQWLAQLPKNPHAAAPVLRLSERRVAAERRRRQS